MLLISSCNHGEQEKNITVNHCTRHSAAKLINKLLQHQRYYFPKCLTSIIDITESRGGHSIGHGCTQCTPDNSCKRNRSQQVIYCNWIQIRIQIVLLGFGGAPSRTAEGKRRGGHTLRMRSSPAKGWAKTGQMAPPLAQSSPPGKEEKRKERVREKRKL